MRQDTAAWRISGGSNGSPRLVIHFSNEGPGRTMNPSHVTSSIQAPARRSRCSTVTRVLLVIGLSVAGLSPQRVTVATQNAAGTKPSPGSPGGAQKPNAWSPIDNDRVRVTAVVSPPAT